MGWVSLEVAWGGFHCNVHAVRTQCPRSAHAVHTQCARSANTLPYCRHRHYSAMTKLLSSPQNEKRYPNFPKKSRNLESVLPTKLLCTSYLDW